MFNKTSKLLNNNTIIWIHSFYYLKLTWYSLHHLLGLKYITSCIKKSILKKITLVLISQNNTVLVIQNTFTWTHWQKKAWIQSKRLYFTHGEVFGLKIDSLLEMLLMSILENKDQTRGPRLLWYALNIFFMGLLKTLFYHTWTFYYS